MWEAFNLSPKDAQKKIRETGYARNDYFAHYTLEEVSLIKARLEIAPGKKVILYAPTWRGIFEAGEGEITQTSQAIDFDKLHTILGEDYVVLFRAHHIDMAKYDLSKYGNWVIDVTGVEDVNELYIISDLLISDYSGTIFDYALLKRPMIFYMYDKEEYINKLSGININLEDLPGPIIEREEDLGEAIVKTMESFEYTPDYERFIEKYNTLDNGHASERVLEKCIPPEDATRSETLTWELVKNKLKFLRNGRRELRRFRYNLGAVKCSVGLSKSENKKRLKSYKNKHRNQRCYLIGNGPSLSPEDLELLKDEICFSCNMIYKIYPKVTWRPTYHCITDIIYTANMDQEISENNNVMLFTHNRAYKAMTVKPDNIIYVNMLSQDNYKVRGNMLAYYIPAKATVMTFMLELAMFMGFREIILLGVDCTNSFASGHFSDEYTMSDIDHRNLLRARKTLKNPALTLFELGEYRRNRSIEAYGKIKKYADRHNVTIRNATRGGALEVFERVQLEETLYESKKI